MGQQQILLIVLSIILVGISISVGITMFRSYAVTFNKDTILLDILNIAASAYQYRMKPIMLGGGGGSYEDFALIPGMEENNNALYEVEVIINDEGQQFVEITGRSRNYPGASITARYDSNMRIVAIEGGGAGSYVINGMLFVGWN